MARYIGARYVPVFAGDWDQTREYEALTVVLYQGDSYTSKMYVPVGIAISNTQYWIKSANFNQQVAAMGGRIDALQGQYDQDIEDLQGDVEDLQGDITTLDNKFNNYIPTTFITGGQFWSMVKQLLYVEEKAIDFANVPAKGIRRGTVNVARSGMTPIGIIGCYTAVTDFIAGGAVLENAETSSAAVRGSIYNAGSQTTNGPLVIKVLYMRNNLE